MGLRSKVVCLLWAYILLSSTASADQPHYWVLLEPGNVRDYHGPFSSFREEVVGYDHGYSVVHRDGPSVPGPEETLWDIDAGGDVWMVGADGELFDTPVCYIDMPIEIGKCWDVQTWGWEGECYSMWCMTGWADWDGVSCLVIQYTYHDWTGDFWYVYWYADGHGLVHFAADCMMCSWWLDPIVVASERATWSEVKALSR